MKKFCILMGSPRLQGNTAELLKPFIAQLEELGCLYSYITLADKKIGGCLGCYRCQEVADTYGCVQNDDVTKIMDEIISSDCIVWSTPIYSWFCTAPMKALLDRHYGLNKFYGSVPHGSLWKDKQMAIIATHGDEAHHATFPFEQAIRNLCDHSFLHFAGIYSIRDVDDISSFQTSQAINGVKDFARKLAQL